MAKQITNKRNLSINGYIGGYDADFDSVNMALNAIGPKELLDVSISSDGGSYLQAMKIYDRLGQHKGKKRIRISPVAASAAAVIALDPEAEVMIPENGLIYHHAAEIAPGEARNPEELRKTADELETVGSTLVTMICNRCGKDPKVVKAMLDEGRWFTAIEALEYGLVDTILPLGRKKTDYSNLVLPEMVTAHLDSLNRRSETMALKDIVAKLKLEVADDADDTALEEAIVNHHTSLLTQVEEAKKVVPKPAEKRETKLPSGIINMLAGSRDLEITNLVSEGKITPAVADKLRLKFANKETFVNCIDDEGEPTDGFDSVISALKENEPVINFGGGGKKKELETTGEPKESALVANARARGSK